ncbi:MAG: hypothetical protein WC842_01205 [Candidatus Paceibacterota bacterium]
MILIIFLFFKFGPLFFSHGFLPGWDTFPHYYALQRTTELFSSFQLFGYDTYWLGGLPLLYFYGPFLFWVGAFFHIISGISLILVWRILLFLILLSVIYAFWFVSFVLWGKKFSFFGIIAGVYFFFFEYHYGPLGIGWRSVFSAGLISSYLGLALNLVFFALSIRFFQSTNKKQQKRALFLLPFILAIIITNSILGSIFSLLVIFSLVLCLLFMKKWNMLVRFFQILVSGILISGFFLVPFLKHLSLSSSSAAGPISQLLLPTLLPFLTYSHESLTNSVVYFYLAAFLFFIFFLKNVLEKTFSLFLFVPFFTFFFFIAGGEFFAFLFPTLSLHYYRAFPYLLSFFLLLSLEGIYIIKTSKQKGGVLNILIYLCVIFVLIRAIFVPISFEKNNITNTVPIFSFFSTNQPYEFSFSQKQEEGYETLIQKLIDYHPQRVFVENYTSKENLYIDKKSQIYPHELTTMLPLKANIPVINGLYVESTYQNPFIQYVTGSISKSMTWGFDFLSNFLSEKKSFDKQLSRLGLFGVDTIIAHSQTFRDELKYSPSVTKLFSFENYDVYHLNSFRPLVFQETRPVGMYFDFSKNRMDNFRILSSSFFLDENLFNYPIAFDYKESANSSSLQDFDYFIFLSDEVPRLKERGIFDILINSKKPLFALRSKELTNYSYAFPKNVTVIDVTSQDFMNEVSSLIFSSIKEIEKEKLYISPSDIQINNHTVSFLAKTDTLKAQKQETKSAWIINLSYFPNWVRSNNEEIFLVNSGQMLTFAKSNNNSVQKIVMTFGRSKEEIWGLFVSFLGVFFLFLLYLFYKKDD